MPRVTGTPQMTNDVIRLYIREHPGKKQYRSDNKLRGCQPFRSIKIRRGKIKYPSPLHTRIQHIKRDPHQHDSHRHSPLTFQ